MKRKFVFVLSLAVMLMGVLSLASQPVNAKQAEETGEADPGVLVSPSKFTPYLDWGQNCGAGTFLGLKPWYDGLCNSDEEVVSPKNDKEVQTFVWTIILNVLFDLLLVVGYLAIGFIVYGGYLYIMSQGDVARAARGKRTLTSAIIGMVIALSASVLVNTIRVILGINENDNWNQGNFQAAQLGTILNWAYTVAGIVAVAYIVKGGFDHMMSQGSPDKIQKATHSIIYAAIGLVIVIFAAVITAFVTRTVGGSF